MLRHHIHVFVKEINAVLPKTILLPKRDSRWIRRLLEGKTLLLNDRKPLSRRWCSPPAEEPFATALTCVAFPQDSTKCYFCLDTCEYWENFCSEFSNRIADTFDSYSKI